MSGHRMHYPCGEPDAAWAIAMQEIELRRRNREARAKAASVRGLVASLMILAGMIGLLVLWTRGSL